MTVKRRDFIKYSGLGALSLCFTTKQVFATANSQDVIFLIKQDAAYQDHCQLFNKRLTFLPKVIALCYTEKGVQQAVEYANQQALTMTIKSGGHSFEGFSLNNDGLVIDVSNMQSMQLTSDMRLLAQPGVTLQQLNQFMLPKGRLVPAGSCGSVGLSGLTLGGGYGFFAREFGLTCDHLIGVRMVTATGEIIDSDQSPELLWACRGGGNGHFGVVTQLRYLSHSAPATLYQHRFRSFDLTPSKATDLARFWFAQTAQLPTHAFSAFVLNGNTLTVMFTATQDDQKMSDILHAFDAQMDTNAGLKPDPIAIGVKYYYGRKKPLNFKNISAGYYQGYEDLESCIGEVFSKVMSVPGALFQINTLGGAINHPELAQQGAYPHRNKTYLGEAQCYWEKSEHQAVGMTVMKELQETLAAHGINQHYANYPDVNIQDYTVAYYGDHYARLQKLKRHLDPLGRFAYPQSVTL
ncbi:FAD-binding oxidoreductase [Marinomonas sp. THO17]|uniref:FAD-binding oxidoreductase n=1 Tax=Marinomonas sp. THO17 TaxID=3149048 RepID=UPI00336BF4DA